MLFSTTHYFHLHSTLTQIMKINLYLNTHEFTQYFSSIYSRYSTQSRGDTNRCLTFENLTFIKTNDPRADAK